MLRFLQFSDLHLDSSLAGSRLGLPPAKRDRINRDIQNALMRAVDLARREEVDVVLVPGDLWDDESVSFQSATQVYDAFASLASIPVLVAPGNHDPYHAFSYHHAAYYQTKTGRPHPANVTVFTSATIQAVQLREIPDVVFYGSCFTENRPRSERILAGVRPGSADSLSVLLLHGSQDDILAPDPNRMTTAPFSRAEILESGFDYVALGHYHRHSVIEDANGLIRAAYGGIPVARGLDEGGERYALLGEIEAGGIRPETLQKVFLDKRQVKRVIVPIDSGVTNYAAAQDRVQAALRGAGVAADDLVVAVLEGRTHPEVDGFVFDSEWRDEQCFHLIVDQSGLEPEYDLESLLADETADKRIEGRFAQRMRDLLEQSQGDVQRTRVLKMALNSGLDALQGREVKPRRVH